MIITTTTTNDPTDSNAARFKRLSQVTEGHSKRRRK